MVDFFQKVGEKAKELGGLAKEATRKSGDLIEVTKLKFELSKLEKEMENNLAGLGALVYQRYRGLTDVDDEIDRLCKSTEKLENEMNEINLQIEKLQPKGLICTECDVELPPGGKYCSYCGSNVANKD